jgi:hypothetical protein
MVILILIFHLHSSPIEMLNSNEIGNRVENAVDIVIKVRNDSRKHTHAHPIKVTSLTNISIRD